MERFRGARAGRLELLPGDEKPDFSLPLAAILPYLPLGGAVSGAAEGQLAAAHLAVTDPERGGFERAATRLGITLNQFLCAGFAALLSRLARQDVVAIVRADSTPSIVTFQAGGEPSFSDFARGMEESRTARLPHLSRDCVGYRFSGENERSENNGSEGPGSETPTAWIRESGLGLIVRMEPHGLSVDLRSALGVWDVAGLSLWLRYLRTIWNAAAETPAQSVKHLPLLDASDLLAFYSDLNCTAAVFPRDEGVPGLISQQAARAPDATAVISGWQRTSYRELEERSTRLAKILAGMGAGKDRGVAVCMERSADMPMALLAVLKAGSCYVPLDPQHPRRRLMTILEECRPVAILSSSLVAATLRIDSIPVLCVDRPWPEAAPMQTLPAADPKSPAYMIYTSGTTGRPKGVMIAHGSLTNLLWDMRRELRFSSSDRMLAIATIAFDIATMDMFLPLISGGTVVVAERQASADAERLAELLQEHDITVLQATPVTWRLLSDSGWSGKRGLKMLSGGEALPRPLANRLLELGGELWNLYGPTETTIYSGAIRIGRGKGIVPIGPPVANTSFYVMDEAGHPLPEGVPGELYIGGAGVGRGYLNRPELTEGRFIQNPFVPQERLFRTGDLVRILNGRKEGYKLEFFGRLDHQVKLRGFRIELGEIESVLREHPSIRDAVVVLREETPGEPGLAAYVTLKEGGTQPLDLRGHAAQLLPEYMIPQHFVVLEKMPLTASGKLDRKALPPPDKLRPSEHSAVPEGELERKLLRIFREVLGEPSIGVTDSFFAWGGYSLLSVKLFTRVNRELDLALPISLLFEAPTVRELARLLEEGTVPSILVPIRAPAKAKFVPLFVIHSYLIYEALAKAMEQDRPIYGLREVEGNGRIQTLEERADLYAKAIAEVNRGEPICLAGWCIAGSLTVEVARRLTEMGYRIGALVLFDSSRPGYEEQLLQRTSWKSRAAALWNFHLQHLRSISAAEKARYFSAGLRRQWERVIERLSTRHRAEALWLQRYFPLAIPAALLNNDMMSITFPANYAWRPYPGKILLLRARDERHVPGVEEPLGWDKVAADGVTVEFVPGTHESMFLEPYLPVFGQKLRQVLLDGERSAYDGTAPRTVTSA